MFIVLYTFPFAPWNMTKHCGNKHSRGFKFFKEFFNPPSFGTPLTRRRRYHDSVLIECGIEKCLLNPLDINAREKWIYDVVWGGGWAVYISCQIHGDCCVYFHCNPLPDHGYYSPNFLQFVPFLNFRILVLLYLLSNGWKWTTQRPHTRIHTHKGIVLKEYTEKSRL